MRNTFKVHIQRYDPEIEQEASTRTYEVRFQPSQTVLEVLHAIQGEQDDTLSFRSSCQAGKCGSCALALDGKPVLACRTLVHGQDLQLGPLPNFPVVKDLIIDRSGYENDFLRMLRTTKAAAVEGRSSACLLESAIDYPNLSCCIGCLVCTSACPVAPQFQEGPGLNPAVLTTVLSSGVRMDRNEGDKAFPIEDTADYCSLCFNCQAACPAGVRLNRVNAQAKDACIQNRGQGLRDWLLGRAELAGKLGSLFPSLSNRTLQNTLIRRGLESTLGISSKPEMVPYARSIKTTSKRISPKSEQKSGSPHVAYFLGCYTRYNDTDPGQDALAVLKHLGFQVEVPDQSCCGLPLMSSGDLAAARKKAEANIASFQPWIEQGWTVISNCTSCSLMLKQEYTEVLGLKTAESFARSTLDLGEFLLREVKAGTVHLDLKPLAMQAAYHTPCHLRAQKIGLPFVELLQLIPDFSVQALNAPCCGQSGSYGYKAEKFELSRAVGSRLADSLTKLQPQIALSECGPCQIRMHDGSGLPVAHPVSILRRALGV